MTSWSVVFSISLMRSTENFARLLICSNASRGIVPISAWTSQTAISTSSHFWNLVSSDHSAPISENVYLYIIKKNSSTDYTYFTNKKKETYPKKRKRETREFFC